MNGWCPVEGRVYSQYLCDVPSERLNGMPRLPRVAPWAWMRRPVGALAEMPPFWDEMSKLQRAGFMKPALLCTAISLTYLCPARRSEQ